MLFNVSLLCVSFPSGPPAAEVCGNNHPPTVCSLAASPVPCMGLFMFLSTNNNLKELSGSSLGMQRCETASRSWMLTVLTDRTDRPGKPTLSDNWFKTYKFTTNVGAQGQSKVWSSVPSPCVPTLISDSYQHVVWMSETITCFFLPLLWWY